MKSMEQQIIDIIAEILGIDVARHPLGVESRLLGALPEFDSMAVLSVLTAIEERFDISIEDDEVEASIFESVGTLCTFVATKRAT